MTEIRPDQVVLASDVYLGDWAHAFQSAKRVVDAKATFFFPSDDDILPLTSHQTRTGTGKKIAGKRFRLYLVEIDDEPGAEPEERDGPIVGDKRYGQQAKDLKLSGFFRAPDVWAAIGTDEQFRAWVTRQPSIMSAAFNEADDNGELRNVACHVRRASESGTGYKPLYACVPMTDDEHQTQHRLGERACYARHHTSLGNRPHLTNPLVDAACQWFDTQRVATVEAWAWETLKTTLGYASMADVHPDEVAAWADEHGLTRFLPRSYREGAA